MANTTTDCETEERNKLPVGLHVRAHTFRADAPTDLGGDDSAPGPHEYFDAALASCKAITAMWYARKNGIALERVETHIERDSSEEKNGKYVLKIRIAFHGDMLTDDDRKRLYGVASRCPIHKLMTTSDVIIETAPL